MKQRPIVLLSTKKLTAIQENMILEAGLSVVSYDAISIEYLDFEVEKNATNIIFSSQNAVRAVFDKIVNTQFSLGSCFCVGQKTASLLITNGQKVLENAKNASDLAEIIVKSYKNESFVFYTGAGRRDELPTLLSDFDVTFKEVITYLTALTPQTFHEIFDGVLFFSPSGVCSYFQSNTLGNGVAFCIGPTTAEEAKKHTNRIKIANHSTIENVIQKAIYYFNSST